MLPDRVSNPGPLTYESSALPIVPCCPASLWVLCAHMETRTCYTFLLERAQTKFSCALKK